MKDIITPHSTSTKEEWLQQLSDVIIDPLELLRKLQLEQYSFLREGVKARRLFPFRVPRAFASKMVCGNPNDPLLRQVFTAQEEFLQVPGFNYNPVNEQDSVVIPGLLQKYHNRALLLVKGGCAINCRYCFRRYFPYQYHLGNKVTWYQAIEYIRQCPELNEIILSGGDPLIAKDGELDELITLLEEIPHLSVLRIHSRLPVVIPTRITTFLCKRFLRCRLKIVLVTHINHAQEIDNTVCESMAQLRHAQVTLLNQSVLLHGVNNDANTLAELSLALFSAGILPYYLHMLDRVQGSSHFMVEDQHARKIMQDLLGKVSGYLIPRLVREIGGERSKIPIDLGLEKN